MAAISSVVAAVRVAELLTIACVVAAILTEKEWGLMTCHAIGMTIWEWASIEATLALQQLPTAPPLERKNIVKKHWLLQLAGTFGLVAAYTFVYIGKERRNKLHLQSWHSWTGITVIVGGASQAVLGVVMYFFPELLGGRTKASTLYAWHRWVGYILRLLSSTTIVLAFNTHWFLRSPISDYFYVVGIASSVISTVCLFINTDSRVLLKQFNLLQTEIKTGNT